MYNTLKYYNDHAEQFVQGTFSIDFAQIQDRFSEKLQVGSRILDFGCGSGRDTKYFLRKGYLVDAVDGSGELCRIASSYTGIEVRQMFFQELDAIEAYDGIWACASVLHLPKTELKSVLKKMTTALKKNGIIYTSFKYGSFEGMRGERYYSDFTPESFREYIRGVNGLQIEELWVTEDARPDRGEEKWLNLILRKADIR